MITWPLVYVELDCILKLIIDLPVQISLLFSQSIGLMCNPV